MAIRWSILLQKYSQNIEYILEKSIENLIDRGMDELSQDFPDIFALPCAKNSPLLFSLVTVLNSWWFASEFVVYPYIPEKWKAYILSTQKMEIFFKKWPFLGAKPYFFSREGTNCQQAVGSDSGLFEKCQLSVLFFFLLSQPLYQFLDVSNLNRHICTCLLVERWMLKRMNDWVGKECMFELDALSFLAGSFGLKPNPSFTLTLHVIFLTRNGWDPFYLVQGAQILLCFFKPSKNKLYANNLAFF